MKQYSRELADTIRSTLDAMGLHYIWDEENGAIIWRASLEKNICAIDGVLSVRETSFTTWLTFPFRMKRTDPKRMLDMAEFLARVNNDIRYGSFDLDYDTGLIRFRLTVDCEGTLPSEPMIEDAVNAPCGIVDQCSAGILAVMYGEQTPLEAAKAVASG